MILSPPFVHFPRARTLHASASYQLEVVISLSTVESRSDPYNGGMFSNEQEQLFRQLSLEGRIVTANALAGNLQELVEAWTNA